MGDWLTIRAGARVLVAAFFGGMICCMFLFTPAGFRFLPRATATLFMRQLVLVYVWVMGIVTNLPALMLAGYPVYRPGALTFFVAAPGFFADRYALTPLLSGRRVASNKLRANAVHRPNVYMHSLQWVTAGKTLVRLSA